MPVRITNKRQVSQPLPDPINRTLRPNEVRFFPYVEYDKLKNDRRYVSLENEGYIIIEGFLLETQFVSAWNQEPKLRLGTWSFWIDGSGYLRMINGTPSSDTDGVVVGPGGGTPAPHGNSHVFTGADPVPNIEVLEAVWTCPSTVAIRDAVYQTGSGSVDRASANTETTMPVIGVVLVKPTPTSCIIARSGEVSGYSLTPDRIYYASAVSPGALTLSPPTGSGRIVQKVGYSKNTTILSVELGETKKRA